MAFGIGINTEKLDSGSIQGRQKEIACECWFTSKGKTIPLMIKYEDEEGIIRTVKDIHVEYTEKKYYLGILSVEYRCQILIQDLLRQVTLIFFQEECRWIMIMP